MHGWHIQQLLKIAAVSSLPEERFCIVDSDNVFFRPFDVPAYAGGERVPLYVERGAIKADAPLHAVWTRNCDRLLGQAETTFPADDYIGNVIVWDKRTVQDLTRTIAITMKRSWQEALCKTRALSEYLLYGHFVQSSQSHFQAHEIKTESLAFAYWDAEPLNAAAVDLDGRTGADDKGRLVHRVILEYARLRDPPGCWPFASGGDGRSSGRIGGVARHRARALV